MRGRSRLAERKAPSCDAPEREPPEREPPEREPPEREPLERAGEAMDPGAIVAPAAGAA